MSSLTPEKVKEIVDRILEYNKNEDIKKELARRGFKIVPNSLKQLIESLEKAGYSVTKNAPQNKESTQSNTPQMSENNKQPVQQKNKSKSETRTNVEENKQTSSTHLPLFLGRPIKNQDNPSTKEPQQSENHTNPENQQVNPISDSINEKWNMILKKAKEHSAQFHSLVFKAEPISIEENQLVISFDQQSTYQLNRLNTPSNINLLNSIVSEIFGMSLTVKPVLSNDNQKSDIIVLPLFGGRNI